MRTIAHSLSLAVAVRDTEEAQALLQHFPHLRPALARYLVDPFVARTAADFLEVVRDCWHPQHEWRVPELAALAAVARLHARTRSGRRAPAVFPRRTGFAPARPWVFFSLVLVCNNEAWENYISG